MTETLQFITPGSLFELEEDVVINANQWGCSRLAKCMGVTDWWNDTSNRMDVTLPAGTVLQINAYRNNSIKGNVGILIVYSPDRRFMPKSRHGTGFRTTIYPKIADFNRLGLKGSFRQ